MLFALVFNDLRGQGGAAIFTKVSGSPVVSTPGDSRSVNWIDVDGDRDLDLFITNGPSGGENNFLYLNDGTGNFSKAANGPITQDGKPSDGATWADVDNDGDADCFVANWYGANNLFYLNNGNGAFAQVTVGQLVNDGGYSETAAWGDYNSDGWVDLYVTNSDGNKRNFLYRNKGDGTFEKVASGAPALDANISRSANWVDFDMDGDVDLFVTNESGQHENLYRNDNGAFTKITLGALVNDGGNTMSSSWGDMDNDGDFDVFLANDGGNDALFRNDGNGQFVKLANDPASTSGGNSFGSNWADVDNDGDLDLFVTNSFWGGPWQNFLFLNDGTGRFIRNTTEVVATDLGWSYGNAFGDFDRDGDLDLAVATCLNANQLDYLYKNNSSENGNHWLVVECTGTTSNRSAIGAKVWVKATIGGQSVTQLREISAQSGYCGQNQLAPHFGLGDATQVESLTVQWPSGLEQVFGNIAANQYIQIVEGQGVSGLQPQPVPSGFALLSPMPNPFVDSVTFSFSTQNKVSVRVEISDAAGNRVRTFPARDFAEGGHQLVWDGRDTGGEHVAGGVYFAHFLVDGHTLAKQVVKVE
ncbi:MAG: FG-GAP-like repeat-containing protein [Saprospiraceae bacterium]